MTLIEILERLRQPVPQEKISQKDSFSKGKKTGKIDYIAWYDLCDLLDERAGIGNWYWEVKELVQIGNRLHLTGILTIIGSDRTSAMAATGTEDIDCSSFGDPSSNAEAMALRRCAAKFGVARYLWAKETKKSSSLPNISSQKTSNKINNAPNSPQAWYEKGKLDGENMDSPKYPKVKPYMEGYTAHFPPECHPDFDIDAYNRTMGI